MVVVVVVVGGTVVVVVGGTVVVVVDDVVVDEVVEDDVVVLGSDVPGGVDEVAATVVGAVVGLAVCVVSAGAPLQAAASATTATPRLMVLLMGPIMGATPLLHDPYAPT